MMITSSVGIMETTVEFTKQYKSGKKVSTIMTKEEMGGSTVEEMEKEFELSWPKTVRKYDLLVEVG